MACVRPLNPRRRRLTDRPTAACRLLQAREAQAVHVALVAAHTVPLAGAQLVVGGLGFTGVKAAAAYVRKMKQRLLGGPLVEPGHPDWPFLSALLARHPRAGAAVQPVPCCPPVQAFAVRPKPSCGDTLELRYVDACGAEMHFSAKACLQ